MWQEFGDSRVRGAVERWGVRGDVVEAVEMYDMTAGLWAVLAVEDCAIESSEDANQVVCCEFQSRLDLYSIEALLD